MPTRGDRDVKPRTFVKEVSEAIDDCAHWSGSMEPDEGEAHAKACEQLKDAVKKVLAIASPEQLKIINDFKYT